MHIDPGVQFIIGSCVNVVGWLVVFSLNVQAQKKVLRNQILDRARIELTDSLRQYQKWLGTINAATLDCMVGTQLEAQGIPFDWPSRCIAFQDFIKDRDAQLRWLERMEDYDVLFPEMSDVRSELGHRQGRISDFVSRSHTALLVSTSDSRAIQGRANAVKEMLDDVGPVMDQLAMANDLMVYLQNKCLGIITKSKTPLRVPIDPAFPVIHKGKRGKLYVKGTTPPL